MLSELVDMEQLAARLRWRCNDAPAGLPPLGNRLADETDD